MSIAIEREWRTFSLKNPFPSHLKIYKVLASIVVSVVESQ